MSTRKHTSLPHLPDPTLTAALSLLPAAGRPRASRDARTGDVLDVVHDHVLRLVGDHDVAERVMLDVVLRATARTTETHEPATLAVLLRLARARLAKRLPSDLDADWLVTLVPPQDPAARAVVTALATLGERGASLLDLTLRHGLDTRTAAGVLGLDVRHAATTRADALRQVRLAVAATGGHRIDVEAVLADLPVVPAPTQLHDRFVVPRAARAPSALAWLAPPAAVAAVAAAILVGLPGTLADPVDDDVPLVMAQPVVDGPAVQQLLADDDGLPHPDDEVVVLPSRPSTKDQPAGTSPSPAPEPTATASPTPAPVPEPTPEPTPDPTPDPSPTPAPQDDPLEELLPTGP